MEAPSGSMTPKVDPLNNLDLNQHFIGGWADDIVDQ